MEAFWDYPPKILFPTTLITYSDDCHPDKFSDWLANVEKSAKFSSEIRQIPGKPGQFRETHRALPGIQTWNLRKPIGFHTKEAGAYIELGWGGGGG